MAIRNRNYFFDPLNTDRFNSRDIPTEQTMIDWSDSVPFIKETLDRSQMYRAGIAKTTSDAKINAGDNTDAAGTSPLGFTTFVRPGQLPKMVDSATIIWNKIPRGGVATGDTGIGVEDWAGTVQFPPDPTYETNDILLEGNKDVQILSGSFPCGAGTLPITVPAGDPLSDYLDALRAAINQANQVIITLSNNVCDLIDNQIGLGDVILSYTPPGTWGTNWIEPAGQLLTIDDYTALFAIFGTEYGGDGIVNFAVPDLVSDQNYLRVKQSSGILMPSGSVTGGVDSRTLTHAEMPDHSHTVTGTTSIEQHEHILPVYNDDVGNLPVIDGNAGQNGFLNYTTPLGGDHSHTLTGTTNTYGNASPDPVWDMNTVQTPRYTNTYLKMRIK